jgi:NitT/TauT family transport system permease protein
MFKSLFEPFTMGRRFSVKFLAAGQLVILLGLWVVAPSTTGLPSPLGVLEAWNTLATTKGMLVNLWISVKVIFEALVLSSLISWSIAAFSTADIGKGLAAFTASLRFLGFAGLMYLFTLWVGSPHALKVAMLTFGMTVFLTRSMADLVKVTPQVQMEIDYARSLGLKGWRLTWELFVRGRSAENLELIRQNAAVGWTLLAMVEGITRSEGGIGAMLLSSNKYFGMENVFAIQLTILAYGVLQDISLSGLRTLLCPWTRLARSDK